MPNIKSAEKRARIANERNLRNRMLKSRLKTNVKKLNTAIEAGDLETAETLYRTTAGLLDRAALKGTLHRNAADRKKAQLAVALNKARG
ncbi:MAG: 30S ribosomal protein S20 [Clostridiales bacterium]|nr:30S ribosomal protein S20 [Clostridiales bacterium]